MCVIIHYLNSIVLWLCKFPKGRVPLKWQPAHKSRSKQSRHWYFSHGIDEVHALHVLTNWPLVVYLDMKRYISRVTLNHSYSLFLIAAADDIFPASLKNFLWRLQKAISSSSFLHNAISSFCLSLMFWVDAVVFNGAAGRISERKQVYSLHKK